MNYKIIEKEKIDCDLKKVPSYLFANTKKEVELLNKEINLEKNKVSLSLIPGANV